MSVTVACLWGRGVDTVFGYAIAEKLHGLVIIIIVVGSGIAFATITCSLVLSNALSLQIFFLVAANTTICTFRKATTQLGSTQSEIWTKSEVTRGGDS